MKQSLLCLIAVAAAFVGLLAGCQKKEPNVTAGAAAKGTSSENITVRLLSGVTGINDKSYNAAAWQGILAFYGNTAQQGSAYDIVVAQTLDMYTPVLRQVTGEGYDLIAAAGFDWADSMGLVAADNPRQKYMIVDSGWLSGNNILQAVYTEHEGSFLAGAAAALKAKEDGITNPRFGFIGGIPDAVITRFEVGYVQGILSIIPNARIVDYYVGSWGEPALAKTRAKNWYDAGVYAIFSAAGNSGNGTIAQAREYRMAGKNVWAIGVDSDQYEEGIYDTNKSAVLTSMLKDVAGSLMYGLNAVKNNAFTGEVITFNLAKGGVGYTATNPALSASIIARLEEIKQKIISGEIAIAATNAEAQTLPGFPHDLKAIDN